MRIPRSALGGLLLAAPLFAQSLVQLSVPPCVEPGSSVVLTVSATLEEGATLKSYDLRIAVDPERATLVEASTQQGAWLPSGGPTFFWRDLIDDVLFVNAAILGPGLHVTGSGVLFTVTAELHGATLADFEPLVHDLFDVSAQVLPSLALPAAVQAPCLEFNLRIEALPQTGQVRLEWDEQPWTESYLVYRRTQAGDWEPAGGTALTEWIDAVDDPLRLYQVRGVFGSQP
jgi:hypothetical protein